MDVNALPDYVRFDQEVACKVSSLDGALLLTLMKERSADHGERWHTLHNLYQDLPWLHNAKILRLAKKLEKLGYIELDKPNRHNFDHSLFYRVK